MSEDLKLKVIDAIDSLIPKGQNILSLREADMAYGIYKAKEAVEKLFTEISTQDCISRQSALEAIDEIEAEVADGDGFQYEKWKQYFCDLPSAQPVITCDGCKFVGTYDTDFPCCNCVRKEKDYYDPER